MKTAYINCTVLDGSKEMETMPNMIILVDNGKITSISSETKVPEDYEIVDLGGRYLMPGLINLHIHLPSNGRPKKKESDVVKLVKLVMSNALTRKLARKLCESYVQMQLMSGVTTVRTVGGIGSIDTQIRQRISEGKAVGPRVLAANMAVSVPGGHMAESLAYASSSVEDARHDVQLIAQDNPDLIKLMITGGVLDATVKGEPGVLRMPAEYVKACCDEAHERGYQVAAHVESPEGVRVALENGVDTIEHGAELDEELVVLFKEKGSKLVCTISPALPFALFDRKISNVTEVQQFNGKVVFDGIISGAKTALENNIPVGLGTDTGCPYTTHYDMWRELVYFQKYVGVSNAFALYTATKRNAEIVGIDDITGSIEVDKCADFLITDENPIEDLTVLRTPYMVVAQDKVIQNPKIKKYEEVERELDKFL